MPASHVSPPLTTLLLPQVIDHSGVRLGEYEDVSKVEKYEISPEAYERRQSTCMGRAGRGLWVQIVGQTGQGHHRLGSGDGAWRVEEGGVGLMAGTNMGREEQWGPGRQTGALKEGV